MRFRRDLRGIHHDEAFPNQALVQSPASVLAPQRRAMGEEKKDELPWLYPGGTPVVFKKRQQGQKRPFLCHPGELPKVGERF